MSTLGSLLRLMQTNRYAYPHQLIPSAQIGQRWTESPAIRRERIYELSLKLTREVTMQDEIARADRQERLVAAMVVDNARNMILREVFDEFKRPLQEAMAAVAGGDRNSAMRILQSVLDCLSNSEPYKDPHHDPRREIARRPGDDPYDWFTGPGR